MDRRRKPKEVKAPAKRPLSARPQRREHQGPPRGAVDVVLGTLSSGQGHMTSFAELLVEGLGWSCPR